MRATGFSHQMAAEANFQIPSNTLNQTCSNSGAEVFRGLYLNQCIITAV